MDRNSPGHYCEDTTQSIKDTEEFVAYVKSLPSFKEDILIPAITPRFVPTCTSTLMNGLAKIAQKYDLPIQSHISENLDEVQWVQELHPECTSYAHVYYKHGLLTNKTIMGHGVYLTADEMNLLTSSGASISHCALSNITLNSGFMPFRTLREAGTKVSLGTDVSGGPSPSMLEAMRHAMSASTVHAVLYKHQKMFFKEAFYLATVGGAEAIGFGDKIGNFKVGKDFDALVIDPYVLDSPFDVFHDNLLQIFEKFIFLGDDRNISQVFVKGRKVLSRQEKLQQLQQRQQQLLL